VKFDQHRVRTAPVLVVGAGNWLISYDRIGPKVLQMCKNHFGPEVGLFNTGSSGLNLLDIIADQELLLIVDACIGNGAVGDIHIVEPNLEYQKAMGSGSHQINPLEVLMVAKCLYPEKLPKKTLFILVETNGMDDVMLERSCRRVFKTIKGIIEQWSAGDLR
jgi:hydrogenase maturation protease